LGFLATPLLPAVIIIILSIIEPHDVRSINTFFLAMLTIIPSYVVFLPIFITLIYFYKQRYYYYVASGIIYALILSVVLFVYFSLNISDPFNAAISELLFLLFGAVSGLTFWLIAIRRNRIYVGGDEVSS